MIVAKLPFLTVNWHVLEPCNFRCRYCFARWEGAQKAALLDPASRQRLFGEIGRLAGVTVSLPHGDVAIGRVRLNFAGGEPFLLPEFGTMIAEAAAAGLGPSFISNGSKISNDFIDRHACEITMAGFSLDAPDVETMQRIGRADNRGHTLTIERLAQIIAHFRMRNPQICIKINTVVCRDNASTDLRPALARLAPDRWKVLRVLPVIGADPIDDDVFNAFVTRHRNVPGIAIEDNNAMRDSYVMIDPVGRIFQNSVDGGYTYSDSIPDVGIAAALAQTPFQPVKFQQRYH